MFDWLSLLCDAFPMTTTVSQNIRLRFDLSYHGAQFHGWAKQAGLRTVQGALESALAKVLRTGVELVVAGRTDAGVHAAGQVAHCDVPRELWLRVQGRSILPPEVVLCRRVNAVLSHEAQGVRGYSDVVIHKVSCVSPEFDARFSALWRSYTYRIADGVELWDPRRTDVLWLDYQLDVDAMNRAAQPLLGEHDFLSYCKPREGASTVRTLLELGFRRDDDGVLLGLARADAFCHSQVRTLMGTLIEVGRGAQGEDFPARRLEEKSRSSHVIVAPPHPLTLEAVGYPEESEYGVQARAARRFRGETRADSGQELAGQEECCDDCDL
ncbi:tRNA pseudouridine synthase A [Arcanobacterium bovis]